MRLESSQSAILCPVNYSQSWWHSWSCCVFFSFGHALICSYLFILHWLLSPFHQHINSMRAETFPGVFMCAFDSTMPGMSEGMNEWRKIWNSRSCFFFPGFPCDQFSFLYLMFQAPSFWSTSKPWWKQSNHTHACAHTHALTHLQEDTFTHPVWSWWNSAMEESWTA